MIKSKFTRLYLKLDKAERAALKKWIQSPLHLKHKEVKRLFEYYQTRKKISKLSLNRYRVFEFLYPQQEYDDLKLRHLYSNALKILEEFVRFFCSFYEDVMPDIHQVAYYRHKQLDDFAHSSLQRAQQKLENSPRRNASFFMQAYLAEAEHFELSFKEQRLKESNLQQITQQLNSFYICSILRYACISRTHQNLRKADYSITLLQAVLLEIESGSFNHIPAIMLYYFSYLALSNPEEDAYFQDLKTLLLESQNELERHEYKEVLLFAINYCIKRLNSGDEEYVREAFELYKFGVEQYLLLDDGVLSRFAFKNIAALGLRLKEYDWVQDFIETYATLLEEPYRVTQIHYNRARLHFSKGNFDEAMSLLQQVEYDDVFMNMDAKVMLLKMYYQKEEFDLLESLMSSFLMYLQRKTVLSYHRSNYENIVRLLRKIINLKPYDVKGKAQVRQQIKEARPLTELIWLLEQVDSV